MKVLVVGGTGFIGSHLVPELVDAGHEVTALARDPDPSAFGADVETVAGDVTAYDSIEGAFEGQDAVVNLVALSPLFKPSGGDEMHDVVHRGGTEHCVRAAEEHGVDRFVQLSALGADPDGTTAYIRAKGEAERIVEASSLDAVIVRPSVVFGDGGEFLSFTKKLTPPVVAPLPGGGKTRFQPIWVGDFAPMLAAAVADDEHVGQTYEIGGPEVLTLKEVAKIARGGVTVLPVPMALAGVGLKIGGRIPGFPMGGDQFRSLQFDNTTDDNDIGAFGVETDDMRTLADYVEASRR